MRKMSESMMLLTIYLLSALLSKGLAIVTVGHSRRTSSGDPPPGDTASYCLSWRMAVESNNVQGWRTIPTQCLKHVEDYMLAGQYSRDINLIIDQIYAYLDNIPPIGVLDDDDDDDNDDDDGDGGMDAWILDVDDTCLSNLFYYRVKRFGCDPYDPVGFRTWALRGECSAIPAVLGLFNRLVDAGFKVILLTGRDEQLLGQATLDNLLDQGFVGYHRLIMRPPDCRGQGAVTFKSEMRKQLIEQGYRIWGNVGDQWSDLQGDNFGNRTFKIPNPMYFVP